MQAFTSPNLLPRHSIFIDYFKTLRRRKWIVLYCFIGIVVIILLINTFYPPVYQGEASIIYQEPKDSNFALEIDQSFYGNSAVLNIIEQIKSRSLAEKVALALPAEIIKKFKLPKQLPAHTTSEKYLSESIREKLEVTAVRGTDILKIKVRANDPVAASIITNTYVNQLVDWDVEKNRQEISSIRNFVDRQFSVFQKKLNESEEALRDFKEKNKMISLTDASAEILGRLTEAEVEYNQVKTEREAMQERLKYIQQKTQKYAPSISTDANSHLQVLKKKILDLEMQYSAQQKKGLTVEHPDMLALKKEVNLLQQELVQELMKTAQAEHLIDPLSQIRDLLQESVALEINLETLKSKEKQLKRLLAVYESELQKLPGQELELARLVRNRDVNNKIYSILLEKREEARITEAGKVGTIHIIDLADEPKAPIKPRKLRNFAIGVFLGMILGIGMAFFVDSLDNSLKTQSDVENLMHLPVLTSIPAIGSNGSHVPGKRNHNPIGSYANKQFFNLDLNSPVSEAYRAFELNFSFVNTDQNFKTILVTSPGASEGKTITAINLAEVLAQSGSRTLLIDCDLRRPIIEKILGASKSPGLTDVLIKKSELGQTIQNIAENFDFLPSGMWPLNPSEILKSARMSALLTEVHRKYDFVILDAPPLLPVIDAVVLASKADGVCLVIRSGRTSLEAALRARQILETSHAKIIGVVLNSVDSHDFCLYHQYLERDHHQKTEKEVAVEA